MLGFLRTLLAVCVVLAAGAAGAWFYAMHVYDQPGPLADAKNVLVPHGGLEQVAAALLQAGVIADSTSFRVAALATRGGGAVHAAELAFPAHASLREALAVLRNGHPVQHRLTFAEGLTAAQIAEVLEHAEALTGDPVVPQEGSILPETYSYEYGAARSAIVERARAAMTRALTHAWAGRDADLPLASPHDALVLASIVERETGKPDERPRVAAVFLNRLRRGMPLQSDPTVAYGASGGMGALDRPLTRADLARDDPYNTYRIRGLPPGPICMPGAAALQAVTHPAQTDELYFVADGSGGHSFSRSLDEHQRAVLRLRAREEEARRQPAPASATGDAGR